MPPSALTQPHPSNPLHTDAAARHEEPPRESHIRLVAPREDDPLDTPVGHAHTRPTTPVPSDYLFLAQRSRDDGCAGTLAVRLEDLGDDVALSEDHTSEQDVWDDGAFEITETRLRPILPRNDPGSALPPSSRGDATSLLASVALVPYLRCSPRDIPRGAIDHREGCVLALIDGRTSIEQVLDTSPMPVPDVLRILNALHARGILGLRDS